ncbi:MAG: class I SAM-dependent methyltransferase [Actinomycetota bacterium]|jgi:SAM-dependent methyltransferase|nr:class I SAM-dependent methyltransferase [Actinomycetota bacterium]
MHDHDPERYGAHIAADYDGLYEPVLDTDSAVTCLAELAGGGAVLELGVGTGRLAVPLAGRGLAVHGVDSSPAMVDQLRAKPGGDQVEITIGDIQHVRLNQRFSLAVLAFNTIFALPSQEAQVSVFENVARHLQPGGRFVVEAWVPDLTRFHRGQGVWARPAGGTGVSLEVAWLEPGPQVMRTTQVRLDDSGVRLFPANHRYAWPAELDLMARLAGMVREHRWATWQRDPFVADSPAHVSVYRAEGAA